MRRSPHLAPLLLLAAALAPLPWVATPASADNLRLRWNDCWGDAGAMNQAFACNTNSGLEVLVASFVVPGAIPGVAAIESRVDFQFSFAALPAWWQFQGALACRSGALSLRSVPPATAVACTDWGENGAIGLVSVVPSSFFLLSLQVQSYLPTGTVNLATGQEYFAFSILVTHLRSVGTGACGGCSVPACLAIRYVEIEDTTGKVTTVNSDFNPLDRTPLATWQGGVVGGGQVCPGTTPVQRSTWGAVKSLYR